MISLAIAGFLAGTQTSPSPKVIHASIFRNGYTYLTREVPIVNSGDVEIDNIPESTAGTLWFAATPGVHIKQITCGEVSHLGLAPANSIDDLLRLNVGHEVTLSLKDLPPTTGSIRSVQGDMIILAQSSENRVVFRNQIVSLTSPTNLTVDSQIRATVRAIRVRVETAGPGKLFYVSLEKGLNWDPAYLAEIKGSKLVLTSKATIIDDSVNLDGIEVQMATLPPGFSNPGILEALVTGSPNATSSLAGGHGLVGDSIDFISYDPTDNSLVTTGERAPVKSWAQATGVEGIKREDQYFYRQPDVRLKPGERAQFVLYEKEVPFSEQYTLSTYAPSGSGGFYLSAFHQPVIHSIKFKNQTGQPLTAAPIATIIDGELVGRGGIAYTGLGQEAEYLLGVAPDVDGNNWEEETARIHNAKTKDKETFDLVTVKGIETVENRSAKKISLALSRAFTGELLNTSIKPLVRQIPTTSGPNSYLDADWSLSIDAGKKLTITYTYQIFVSNGIPKPEPSGH